jgi:hypothetical protein
MPGSAGQWTIKRIHWGLGNFFLFAGCISVSRKEQHVLTASRTSLMGRRCQALANRSIIDDTGLLAAWEIHPVSAVTPPQ